MATKTVPAKKKATPAKEPNPSTDDSQETSIITIKKASCKNLQGTATLEYHIGRDAEGDLHWKIHSNTGNGMYSRQWTSFDALQKVLAAWSSDTPITSLTLSPLFTGSINTRSFLLATLVNEGILQQVPDKKRHYQLGDAKPFLAAMKELTVSDSKTGKAKPKTKAKATSRMPKEKAKPATGE